MATESIISGAVAGLIHAGIAITLWNRWFDTIGEILAIKPLNGMYIGLGMFVLGFIPAWLYASRKIVSPAIIITSLLVVSVVGSWLSGSVNAPSAAPTPFGWYILSWVGIAGLAGLSGVLELRRSQRTGA